MDFLLADVFIRAPQTGKLMRSLPFVMEYTRKIHDRYFPDYALWKEE